MQEGRPVAGIQEVVWSTFDIDRACAAMIEVGGYRRVDLPDPGPGQWHTWNIPAHCTRIEQALLLPAEGTRGAIRVVRFHGVEQQLIRPSQRPWDTGGIFDVDIFSRDVRSVYARLQRLGWSAFGEPVDYTMGEFDVTQVVATGPDGIVLALIEPHKPLDFELQFTAMSRVFNSTQIVRDMDATLDFYCGTLGWKALVDLTVDNAIEPGADVLGMPMPFAATAKRRVAIVHPQGINDGSVELIQICDWHGKDYAPRAIAPNIGLLSLRFPVTSVATFAADIESRGGALHTRPSLCHLAPATPAPYCAIRSPDGALLEFYEDETKIS